MQKVLNLWKSIKLYDIGHFVKNLNLRKLPNYPSRKSLHAIMIMLIGVCLMGVFLSIYFQSYQHPFMAQKAMNISDHWAYQLPADSQNRPLNDLTYAVNVPANQPLKLYKHLTTEIENAALLIKTNHQTIRLFLDGQEFFSSGSHHAGKNPGMELFFVSLPKTYVNQELTMEIISPYSHYSGRTSPVYLGDIQSLEAYTLSQSMRSVIFMSICIFLGFCTILLTIAQAFRNEVNWGNFSLGIFAIVWGLYYLCTDYIAYQFFAPLWMSKLSIGLYFFMQVPLSLFFYFSSKHYKKQFLFAAAIHCTFVFIAYSLQALDLKQFPDLLNVNNFLYTIVFLYMILFSFLEIQKGNRLFLLITPFMSIAYISLMKAFIIFYNTRGPVNYNIYKDTFLLLILAVLVYNIVLFFKQYYQRQKNLALLTLKNRLAFEQYDQLNAHLTQVAGLKHEMKNHFAALQILCGEGKYEQCNTYLGTVTQQLNQTFSIAHCQHFLINAVINKCLHTAKIAAISVEYKLHVPAQLQFSDPDLYSLLTNILENAIEANENIQDPSKRYIKLNIHKKEPYLVISCENGKSHELLNKDGQFLTTKKDQANHGYGLRTIQQIAQKYDGMVDINHHENDFKIRVALKENLN